MHRQTIPASSGQNETKLVYAVKNKLKSLKVAQVKDEMDDNEADGCDSVCDVPW